MPLRALMLILIGSSTCLAGHRPLELHWDELPAYISGETVNVTLAGGVRLKARVEVIRPNEMAVQVKKSSDLRLYPIGGASIARAAVQEIILMREHDPVLRDSALVPLALTLLTPAAFALGESGSGSAAAAVLVGGTAAVTVGIHFGLRKLREERVRIRVVP